MSERLVIIGGVAAGTKAAATARRRNAGARIVLLQEEADVSYSACGLPYHLADLDRIPRSKLIARPPEAFRVDGIDMRTRHRVEEIDLDRGSLRVCDLQADHVYTEPFDRLLLATGARPKRLNVPASPDAPPIAYLRSIVDADRIVDRLPDIRRVVILGGGYIGLEAAEAFSRLGREVAIVEMMPRLLPAFALPLGQAVEERVRENGVELFMGSAVSGLDRKHVVLDNGERISADLVLVATGVTPSTELAAAAGITLGHTGAITVNAEMQTNLPHVYAAGDCAESYHRVANRAVWLPLGDVANRHGKVAGTNMAGGRAVFPGVLGTAIFKVFGLAVARTGLGEAEAVTAGYRPISQVVEVPSRARYMEKSRNLLIHLTADRASGKVLGCQVTGDDAADKTIDTVAAALWGNLAVEDLADLDLAYAPPFLPVLAPVQVAGEVLKKQVGAMQG
ncbi:FAD-dependent oxidoreductase [Methylohalobius crimeensis]|uniref:FAD-dependent oxidoreductase n=1 Tax=Methylohalobius crimeensis TaxID=244365 RepID=UPI0003B662E3|nr:FAD-dependent oxidoreductase [Methylohalobius crimeensis]